MAGTKKLHPSVGKRPDLVKTAKELMPENPLVKINEVMTVSDEIEKKTELIQEVETLSLITKEVLMAKRQRMEMEIDNRKLDVAEKAIDTVDKIIQAVSEADVIERVAKNIRTPQDMKYMAEAADRLSNTLKSLMNPNVIDEMGTKRHRKFSVMFRSSGAVDAAVQIESHD